MSDPTRAWVAPSDTTPVPRRAGAPRAHGSRPHAAYERAETDIRHFDPRMLEELDPVGELERWSSARNEK